MTKMRVASFAVAVCLVQGAAAQPGRQNALVGIMQAELMRNVDVLKQQPVPAYYAAYTLHDSRSTQILASFGAIDRSEESRQRFATVEVRVGDYQLDNTHPIFHSFFELNDITSIPTAYNLGSGPQFWALFEDNDPKKRMLCIANYMNDLSEFWEFSEEGRYIVSDSNLAYKFGVNEFIYGLTH